MQDRDHDRDAGVEDYGHGQQSPRALVDDLEPHHDREQCGDEQDDDVGDHKRPTESRGQLCHGEQAEVGDRDGNTQSVPVVFQSISS